MALNVYNTLALMKDRLIAYAIDQNIDNYIGPGNINIVASETTAGNYGYYYIQLSYGGTLRWGGYGGGNMFRFWAMNVDIHVIHHEAQINASRRHAEDLSMLAEKVMRAYYLWYPYIQEWDSGTDYVAGDYVWAGSGDYYRALDSTTNDDPSSSPLKWQLLNFDPPLNLLQPIGIISDNEPQLVTENGRLEYRQRLVFELSSSDEPSSGFFDNS